MPAQDQPLRIALLAYRGKPHVGGQGIYIRHLAKALVDLGHHVEVLGGQPYPVLDERVPLVELPSLDIYNDYFPLRMPGLWELKHWPDFVEVASFSAGTFPEPLAFSLRAWDHLRHRVGEFDVVHDNQTLGYGLLAIQRDFPVLSTIHHPITVDRRLELEHAEGWYRKFSLRRWYAFTNMQSRVASRMQRVVTVSRELVPRHRPRPRRPCRAHARRAGRRRPGPVPPPSRRRPGPRSAHHHRVSADVTMKGLAFLLEAVAKLRTERHDIHLTVIGRKKEGGASARKIDELGLDAHITFVTGVSDERIVELYAEAEVAVVPSLYEGFSLPAIEAMSCGIPLVATTGGALPEVVGPDGETALAVPPGDAEALAARLRGPSTTPSCGHASAPPAVSGSRASGPGGTPRSAPSSSTGRCSPRPAPTASDRDRGPEARHAHRRLQPARPAGRRPPPRPGLRFRAARLRGLPPRRPGRGPRLRLRRAARRARPLGAIGAEGEGTETSTADAVNGDACNLRFADASFDRIIASEVIEHVPDDVAALDELTRVLRPGGTMAVTVPAWLPEKICWALSDEYHAPFVEGGHVRIYTEGHVAPTACATPASSPAGPTWPTRCTRRTGGSAARWARPTTTTRW